MKEPLVSVIVTTKNEEKNIGACLKSINSQEYKNIEMIVVDNNSTDRTKEIASQYTEQVHNKGPERSAQRNFGVKTSRGEWILYLDADMILSEGVIAECVDYVLDRPKVKGLYIPERIVGDGFWIRVRNFERRFYDGTVIDAVRFIHRQTFLSIGGFDTTLTGPEDWDLDKRIRIAGNVGMITSHLLHNEGSFSSHKYLGKKSFYLDSISQYIEKWGTDDPDVKKQLGFWYRYFGLFWQKQNIRNIFNHPVYVACMYYLRFRVGMLYAKQRILS
jgi:glycosyltransferase involved in cell wall biosynthesis